MRYNEGVKRKRRVSIATTYPPMSDRYRPITLSALIIRQLTKASQ